jgi:uncharacterized membrane protein YjjP (DUF1212 family)
MLTKHKRVNRLAGLKAQFYLLFSGIWEKFIVVIFYTINLNIFLQYIRRYENTKYNVLL